jgi:hypothetical protein
MRAALVVALVAGCGPTFVKLDVPHARRLDVALVGGGTAICPAAGTPELRALVTYVDNKTVQTRSRVDPRGTLRPGELRWTSDVGTVDTDARLHLPALRDWHDRPISITVNVPGRPEIADRIVLVPTFDCDAWSSDDGRTGDTGGNGAHGGHVEVALGYVDTSLNGRLVLARVVADGGPAAYYLIDRRGPSAAHFTVSARGGAGGDGRDGSDGINGSDGSSGHDGSSGGTCEDGTNGSDGGDGGDGGDGSDGSDAGDGGDGGEIVISYPAEFPELADLVDTDVAGGRAGSGGSGGSAGAGGSGGRGGSGGSAGSTIASDGSSCSTRSGSDGRAGRDGRAGMAGTSGSDGRDGANGTVIRRAVPAQALLADEVADGWAIVR